MNGKIFLIGGSKPEGRRLKKLAEETGQEIIASGLRGARTKLAQNIDEIRLIEVDVHELCNDPECTGELLRDIRAVYEGIIVGIAESEDERRLLSRNGCDSVKAKRNADFSIIGLIRSQQAAMASLAEENGIEPDFSTLVTELAYSLENGDANSRLQALHIVSGE